MTITVGQHVLFHPLKGVIHHSLPPDVILTAIIAHVLPDGRLNLDVLDINGVNHSMTNVPLIAKGETVPERGYYAEFPESLQQFVEIHAANVLNAPLPKSAEDAPLSAASKPTE